MRLLKKVKTIEVKRSFVIADFIRHHQYGKAAMSKVGKIAYQKQLAKAKRTVVQIPEGLLDLVIRGTTRDRISPYNTLAWYLAEVDTNEVRVWPGAGGLPKKWTRGSLRETGDYVREALKKNPRGLGHRAQTAIPEIIKISLPLLQKEKYLLPIVLPFGTLNKKGRTRFKGDIDDGCMRSIALAVSGKKNIKLYFGIPKKK
jgi:hypothetical protein